jgi:hypothetical protein
MKTATNIQNNPHSRNSGERKSPGPYPDTAEMPGQMRLPKMMAGRDIRK